MTKDFLKDNFFSCKTAFLTYFYFHFVDDHVCLFFESPTEVKKKRPRPKTSQTVHWILQQTFCHYLPIIHWPLLTIFTATIKPPPSLTCSLYNLRNLPAKESLITPYFQCSIQSNPVKVYIRWSFPQASLHYLPTSLRTKVKILTITYISLSYLPSDSCP